MKKLVKFFAVTLGSFCLLLPSGVSGKRFVLSDSYLPEISVTLPDDVDDKRPAVFALRNNCFNAIKVFRYWNEIRMVTPRSVNYEGFADNDGVRLFEIGMNHASRIFEVLSNVPNVTSSLRVKDRVLTAESKGIIERFGANSISLAMSILDELGLLEAQ